MAIFVHESLPRTRIPQLELNFSSIFDNSIMLPSSSQPLHQRDTPTIICIIIININIVAMRLIFRSTGIKKGGTRTECFFNIYSLIVKMTAFGGSK